MKRQLLSFRELWELLVKPLVAWNCSWWKCLHHRNWQMMVNWVCFPQRVSWLTHPWGSIPPYLVYSRKKLSKIEGKNNHPNQNTWLLIDSYVSQIGPWNTWIRIESLGELVEKMRIPDTRFTESESCELEARNLGLIFMLNAFFSSLRNTEFWGLDLAGTLD